LTIALETGFRSLSSFNKAFKEAHNMTPTAYRRQQLGEAASV
jgi:AraC-like DNA-binding protein